MSNDRQGDGRDVVMVVMVVMMMINFLCFVSEVHSFRV